MWTFAGQLLVLALNGILGILRVTFAGRDKACVDWLTGEMEYVIFTSSP